MSSDRVKARWNGPFPAQMGPGIVIEVGDEWEVTPGDLLSGHWTPVGTEAKKAEKAAVEEHAAAHAEAVVEPSAESPPEPEGES